MSKQTAVEWLIYNINEISKTNDLYRGTEFIERYHMIEVNRLRWLVKSALRMEKKQIEDAFNEGENFSKLYFLQPYNTPECKVYYQAKYGGDHD
jgi:hypothetical protein